MAVFYKWIKGCPEGASLNNGLWTYITWSNSSSGKWFDYLPQISVKKDGSTTDLGSILTSGVSCNIAEPWTFTNGIHVDTISMNNASKLTIKNDVHIWGSSNSGKLIIQGTTTAKDKIIAETGINSTGPIICTNNYIQALYFDATSDIRAKTDIKQLNIKAAELIKDLSIYTFKYKENNEPSIGIMAQDLLELQPDGLDLVVNKDATGEDNDYMSIKEDKLIYILMKAIQEQQIEIEELKSKIDLLTK